MMLALALLFPPLAAAAEAPAAALLDDVDRWRAGADALVDGPAGCWVFEGEARQVLVLHSAPDRFSTAGRREIVSSGPFVARIEDGVWTRIDYRRRSEGADGEPELETDLVPLIGRTAPEGEGDGVGSVSISIGGEEEQISGGVNQSVSLLRDAVERWTGSVETSYARWDAGSGAVLFVRDVPVSEGARDTVQVVSHFPEAGPRATRIDAVWPRTVKIGRWPLRITVRDPQMHLQGFDTGEVVLPNAETVSLVVGAFGFTVGYEQVLRYATATPCTAGPAEAESEAPGPGAEAGDDGIEEAPSGSSP